MSWLILSCSMQLISSGYFSSAEDCNYSPARANEALTSLIAVEKEEWRGWGDRCCLGMSSVNDAFVALWEELASYKEKSYNTKWTVLCNSNFFRFPFDKVFPVNLLQHGHDSTVSSWYNIYFYGELKKKKVK